MRIKEREREFPPPSSPLISPLFIIALDVRSRQTQADSDRQLRICKCLHMLYDI